MAHRRRKMEGQGVGRVLRILRNQLPRLRAGPSQNNPREAVKEPESSQEHALPSFAGGPHFFEYLVVVSLKKKRSGDDYEPTITYQFPKRENLLRGQQEEEERLLSAIPLFCFPDGNEWASHGVSQGDLLFRPDQCGWEQEDWILQAPFACWLWSSPSESVLYHQLHWLLRLVLQDPG